MNYILFILKNYPFRSRFPSTLDRICTFLSQGRNLGRFCSGTAVHNQLRKNQEGKLENKRLILPEIFENFNRLLLSHLGPQNPRAHMHLPVTWSHLAPFAQLHRFVQFSPQDHWSQPMMVCKRIIKMPDYSILSSQNLRSWHLSPTHPGGQEHTPET